MSVFDKLVKSAENEYATKVIDGIPAGDVDTYIDTGSYAFNALLSGSIHGGIPNNKITAIAGEEATGKTFFTLGIVKSFLDENKDAGVFYFESEGALTKDLLEQRNVDTNRVWILPVTTIQEFRQQALRMLNEYNEDSEKPPCMMVLDSLGNLSTTKEIEDMTEGKETRDMTRTQLIRGTFRALSLKLSKAKIPFILTNHTYQVIGSYIPTRDMSGGGGVKYAASQIVMLSKKKDRDGKEVIGNIIHCNLTKSRLTRENQRVDVRLHYDTGLNRYYGLVPIAEKYEIFKKVSTRFELPDGSKVFEKTLNNDPEKYFTDEIMEKIDEACKKEFLYGE